MSADAASGKVFVARHRLPHAEAICQTLRAEGFEAVTVTSPQSVAVDAHASHPGCLVAANTPHRAQTTGAAADHSSDGGMLVVSLSRVYPWAEAAEKGALNLVPAEGSTHHLLRAVRQAIADDAHSSQEERGQQELFRRIDQLSPRDRQVMRLIYDEYPNKAIAAELDISQRTVEGIRAKIFRTLGVATGIGLARRLAESHYFS